MEWNLMEWNLLQLIYSIRWIMLPVNLVTSHNVSTGILRRKVNGKEDLLHLSHISTCVTSISVWVIDMNQCPASVTRPNPPRELWTAALQPAAPLRDFLPAALLLSPPSDNIHNDTKTHAVTFTNTPKKDHVTWPHEKTKHTVSDLKDLLWKTQNSSN